MGERRAPRPAGDTGRESFPVSGLGVILGDPWLSGTGRDSRRCSSSASSSRAEPKPRWDVHLRGAGSPAGVHRPFGQEILLYLQLADLLIQVGDEYGVVPVFWC